MWPWNKSVTYKDKNGNSKQQSAANTCGDIYDTLEGEDGACLDLNIWQSGTTTEVHASWIGECLLNDDTTFYIKVFDYGAPDVDCAEPYKLEITAQ